MNHHLSKYYNAFFSHVFTEERKIDFHSKLPSHHSHPFVFGSGKRFSFIFCLANATNSLLLKLSSKKMRFHVIATSFSRGVCHDGDNAGEIFILYGWIFYSLAQTADTLCWDRLYKLTVTTFGEASKAYINHTLVFGAIFSFLNELDIYRAGWLANSLIKYCNRIFIKPQV